MLSGFRVDQYAPETTAPITRVGLPQYAASTKLTAQALAAGSCVAAASFTIEDMAVGALRSASLRAMAVIVTGTPIGMASIPIGAARMTINGREQEHGA